MKFKYNQDTQLLVFKFKWVKDFYSIIFNLFSVDNQFKEVNPHPLRKGAFQTDKDGNSVKRDLKFHHNTLW